MTENQGKHRIKDSDTERDLGVQFDKDLKFRNHISNCINKANRITGLVRRSFVDVKLKSFKKLYKTLIRPHVEYCNIIWSPHYKKDIEAIERIQRRSTKLVKDIKDLPYERRLQHLQLPSLSYRRFRGDMLEIYKILHSLEDISIDTFFTLSSLNTRTNGQKLVVNQCRLDLRKHFFSIRAVKEWNKLPASVVNATSLNIFKNRIDAFMDKKKYTVYPENKGWVHNHEVDIRVNLASLQQM